MYLPYYVCTGTSCFCWSRAQKLWVSQLKFHYEWTTEVFSPSSAWSSPRISKSALWSFWYVTVEGWHDFILLWTDHACEDVSISCRSQIFMHQLCLCNRYCSTNLPTTLKKMICRSFVQPHSPLLIITLIFNAPLSALTQQLLWSVLIMTLYAVCTRWRSCWLNYYVCDKSWKSHRGQCKATGNILYWTNTVN